MALWLPEFRVEIVHDPEYNHVTLSLHDHHQVHLTTWIMFLRFKFSSLQQIVNMR